MDRAATKLLILSLLYVVIFLASAFAVKRGLMLGGKGRDAYYPGSLPGPGGYAQERKILGALGIAVSEFPLDLVFSIPFLLWVIFAVVSTISGFFPIGPIFVTIGSIVLALLAGTSSLNSWFRRKKLGRC